MIEKLDPQLFFLTVVTVVNAPLTLQLKKEFNFYDIVSLGKGRSQLYMATLPRLKSRVRIPSPAPINPTNSLFCLLSFLKLFYIYNLVVTRV